MHHMFYVLFSTLLLLLPLSVSAGEIDKMDWKRGDISAAGVGVPPARIHHPAQRRAMACLAAKVAAQASLLETTKGVRIDSVSLVRDAMLESQVIRTAVKGTLVGARMAGKRILADDSCEITMVIPMAGSLFSALISEEEYYKRVGNNDHRTNDHRTVGFSERMKNLLADLAEYGLISEAHAGIVPEIRLEDESQLILAKKLMKAFADRGDQVAATLMEHAIRAYEQISEFTGVVIDASHLPEFHAAMLPLIRDHEGVMLYPNKNTPYKVVRSRMPVSYDWDMSDAVKSDRVAINPWSLKPLQPISRNYPT